MKRFSIVIGAIFLTINAFSQKDPGAVKILDKFSAKALGAPSISMSFTLETIDQVEGTNTTTEGSIVLSKDKYRLDLKDNIVWFNGETVWSYLPAEKEVTVSKPGKKDDSFQSKPSSVFSLYKKGYKIRLIEENENSYLIDLYPEDIKSDHIRLRLLIGKQSLNLISAEYKYKNGITIQLTVKNYDLSKTADLTSFVFPSDNYKGVEIIDMR